MATSFTARFHGGTRWNAFWRKVRPSGIPQEIPPGLRFPTPAEARSPPNSKSEGQQRVAFHMKILYGHMLPCPCAGQRCSTAHLYHSWPGHGLRREPPRAPTYGSLRKLRGQVDNVRFWLLFCETAILSVRVGHPHRLETITAE